MTKVLTKNTFEYLMKKLAFLRINLEKREELYSYIVGNFVTDIPAAKDVRSLSLGLSLGFVNVYAEVRLCAHYNLSK